MRELPLSGSIKTMLNEHLAVVLGLAASILVTLKILAVGGWDVDIALAILDAKGTANVLTGTLLSLFPYLLAFFYLTYMLKVERLLSQKEPVERAAANLTHSLIILLMVNILPASYLILIILMLCTQIIVRIFRLRKRTKAQNESSNRKKAKKSSSVSLFEKRANVLSLIFLLAFGTLQIPWIPAETAEIEGDRVTVYVLKHDDETARVLVQQSRLISQLESHLLTGDYCELNNSWWMNPISDLWRKHRLEPCPTT